jgi:uncharacterized protein YggE
VKQRPSPLALGILAGLGLVAAAALALGATGTTTTAAATTSADPSAGVHVTGLGGVTGRPDVLRFTVGVEVTADTVDEALSQANAAAERLLATLRDRGIAEEDLQTAGVQVFPRYDDRGRQVTGYVVGEDVNVTVRDLDAAGETISAAVEAGGEAARLSGVTFALEDDEELLAAARERAFAQARTEAEQYADLVGRDLGEVLSVRETLQPSEPMAYAARAESAAGAAADVPLAPGSARVTVAVDVRWALS